VSDAFYCSPVIFTNRAGADPQEIGVVAPYRAQVRAIRELLKEADLAGVEVGSVEQFQGQVRAKWRFCEMVVLILAPFKLGTKGDHFRHNSKQLRSRQAESVGFLTASPTYEWSVISCHLCQCMRPTHPLLVAITRAQALLIVIGDPEALGKDELWRTFMNYVVSSGGWTGKTPSWRQKDEVPVPGYNIIRRDKPVYGEGFIGGKSEQIYRYHRE
jgi:helicase MOV-10